MKCRLEIAPLLLAAINTSEHAGEATSPGVQKDSMHLLVCGVSQILDLERSDDEVAKTLQVLHHRFREQADFASTESAAMPYAIMRNAVVSFLYRDIPRSPVQSGSWTK